MKLQEMNGKLAETLMVQKPTLVQEQLCPLDLEGSGLMGWWAEMTRLEKVAHHQEKEIKEKYLEIRLEKKIEEHLEAMLVQQIYLKTEFLVEIPRQGKNGKP
ncbi:unnamed protein product [Prunus armeniaca]|uniref:Uncharacterized protein n=1 Tax=Prunus armeniaca TaxID=36596 RepID=A0A6J5XHC6_PRUAR|nr:unnamed protein product [Prunus armeniaca]CAB4311977.1 unnamed protein product [Prunus armeniaca]